MIDPQADDIGRIIVHRPGPAFGRREPGSPECVGKERAEVAHIVSLDGGIVFVRFHGEAEPRAALREHLIWGRRTSESRMTQIRRWMQAAVMGRKTDG
jgi:hypothetical protein